MKISEKIKQSKSYAIGYEQGKNDTVDKLLKFVDEESKFIPNNDFDYLLNRLVNELKKLKE